MAGPRWRPLLRPRKGRRAFSAACQPSDRGAGQRTSPEELYLSQIRRTFPPRVTFSAGKLPLPRRKMPPSAEINSLTAQRCHLVQKRGRFLADSVIFCRHRIPAPRKDTVFCKKKIAFHAKMSSFGKKRSLPVARCHPLKKRSPFPFVRCRLLDKRSHFPFGRYRFLDKRRHFSFGRCHLLKKRSRLLLKDVIFRRKEVTSCRKVSSFARKVHPSRGKM